MIFRKHIVSPNLVSLALIIVFSVVLMGNTKEINPNSFVNTSIKASQNQYRAMLLNLQNSKAIPRSIHPEGTLKTVSIYDWTSGFFAGSLWKIYELSGEEYFKDQAIKWTEILEPVKNYKDNHDIGFMIYCSYGNGYKLNKSKKYEAVILQTAKTLCTRFNRKVGCIKSWNKVKSLTGSDTLYYPVIMDNMMNLELLFAASKISGDSFYRNIAITHANTTLNNHLRKNFSSFHVINYDTLTGNAINKETNQGYSHNSTWARGQAWGIYGYTVMYRETNSKAYLKVAEGMADYYLKQFSENTICDWDFNVNDGSIRPSFAYNTNKYKVPLKDASSAAIVASALLELATYANKEKSYFYKKRAHAILKILASPDYLATENTNGNFLLKHSVGNFPAGYEIDVPLNYADYYFLEAILRLKNSKLK